MGLERETRILGTCGWPLRLVSRLSRRANSRRRDPARPTPSVRELHDLCVLQHRHVQNLGDVTRGDAGAVIHRNIGIHPHDLPGLILDGLHHSEDDQRDQWEQKAQPKEESGGSSPLYGHPSTNKRKIDPGGKDYDNDK